ncbi:MAG: hypothetical protein C4534_08230 [Gaiellales bacterium]|nr:MAG: hypothetical protein C4534_08230 [Gaiellales bacterium]
MWRLGSKVGAGSVGGMAGMAGTPVVVGALIAGSIAELFEPPVKQGTYPESFVDGIVDGSMALFAQALTQEVLKSPAPDGVRP